VVLGWFLSDERRLFPEDTIFWQLNGWELLLLYFTYRGITTGSWLWVKEFSRKRILDHPLKTVNIDDRLVKGKKGAWALVLATFWSLFDFNHWTFWVATLRMVDRIYLFVYCPRALLQNLFLG